MTNTALSRTRPKVRVFAANGLSDLAHVVTRRMAAQKRLRLLFLCVIPPYPSLAAQLTVAKNCSASFTHWTCKSILVYLVFANELFNDVGDRILAGALVPGQTDYYVPWHGDITW